RWLKKLWRFAYSEDLVPANIMDGVNVEIEKRERDRVYTAQEIKNIWKATQSNHLSFEEGAYVKLLMLLAPRKTALAYLQRSHLDDSDNPTIWTVPQHLVKMRKRTNKKRVYVIPLPPLAKRIVKQLLTRHKGEQ